VVKCGGEGEGLGAGDGLHGFGGRQEARVVQGKRSVFGAPSRPTKTIKVGARLR
jgi:hypothetical protein